MTLYFADEVPLTVNQPNHLADSFPLLDDPQQNGSRLSTSSLDVPAVAKGRGNRAESDSELDVNRNRPNTKAEENQNGSFNDGPGAVVVNLLTSLRHLPPAMHSVLIVMALSWVGVSIDML